jgi:hypothetical protein
MNDPNTDCPGPLYGRGKPVFTVRQLLPWFFVCFILFLSFMHWVAQ